MSGLSSRLILSRCGFPVITSKSNSVMELFLTFTVLIIGISAITDGNFSNELEHRSRVSNMVQLVISPGRLVNLLLDRSKEVIKQKLFGSFGGILVIKLPDRLQEWTLANFSSRKTASGT